MLASLKNLPQALKINSEPFNPITMKNPFTNGAFVRTLNSVDAVTYENLDFASKAKMKVLAYAAMLTIFIYSAVFYFATTAVFEKSIVYGLLAAVAGFLIVFQIERIILIAKGNGWLTFVRFILVLAMSFLGAFVFDGLLFKDEIAETLEKQKLLEITERVDEALKKNVQFNTLAGLLHDAQKQFETSSIQFNEEMGGSNGRAQGKGRWAKAYEEQMAKSKAEINTYSAALDSIKMYEKALVASNLNSGKGFLNSFDALHSFMKAKPASKLFFWVFLVIMLILESLSLILKTTSTSPYEYNSKKLSGETNFTADRDKKIHELRKKRFQNQYNLSN